MSKNIYIDENVNFFTFCKNNFIGGGSEKNSFVQIFLEKENVRHLVVLEV